MDFAGSRKVHRAGEVEQRGLAAAAPSDQRQEFTGLRLKRNVAESGYDDAVGSVALTGPVEAKDARAQVPW